MKLGEVACVHKNMSWADFWIVPSGDDVGLPTQEFSRDYIGIMFTADAVFKGGVLPNKFLMWFAVLYNSSGPMRSILHRTENDEIVVNERLVRNMKVPNGSVPNAS